MAEFPKLAAEVTASLLGLYLATVSIVVGTVYQDVSADIRSLVLGGSGTLRRLRLTGAALGVGLFLVLLESLSVPFGMISLGAYALLLAFAALAFGQLAFGSLNLLDPLALVSEPLSQLARSLNRLDRLAGSHDALRRREARRIQHQLHLLSQIVRLSQKRAAISTSRLTGLARNVANALVIYSQERRRIPADSGWHLPAANYPRWVESDNSTTDLAIRTGIPLQGKEEPDLFWLEAALGGLMAEVLAATVAAADRDAALTVSSLTASSAAQVAALRYPDAADVYCRAVTRMCWDMQIDNDAGRAVQGEPPTLLMSRLLGWGQGIEQWPQEIEDSAPEIATDATVGVVRGPRRVLRAVGDLRTQLEAEIVIEGKRISPAWFIRMALADSAIFAIREYCRDLPRAVREHSSLSGPPNQPATNVVALCTQSIQLLEKAQLTLTRMASVLPSFEAFRGGNPPVETPEIDTARSEVAAIRKRVFGQLAQQLPQLTPSRDRSEPDWFGDAHYRCLHELADAVAVGDAESVRSLFPAVMSASLRLDSYVRTTYTAPTYQVNSAVLDPLMDLFEVSGLALIYGEVRQDESARPIVETWDRLLTNQTDKQELPRTYLNLLDISRWGLGVGISPRSVTRTTWEMRLSNDMVARGFARPRYSPFSEHEQWEAPEIAKLLGINEDYPSVSIEPRVFFAARVLAPLSGESDAELRKRPELRRYYEQLDFLRSRAGNEADPEYEPDDEDIGDA
ncbi:MAG: hypothetical protein C4558_07260 [Dehalococcoidia bacterium]|nr:MAG: hypothetical protein C4558_07260 [Dehalococcoidia bacterium]